MNKEQHEFDLNAYSPMEVANRVESAFKAKAFILSFRLVILAMLAGAFVAFGALGYTLVVTDSTLGIGPTRFLGGIAFSVGLVLVVVGGAELFTGNALMIMPLMNKHITLSMLLKNWSIVYVGNFVGAMIIAIMVVLSGVLDQVSISQTVAKIAEGKLSLSTSEAFFRGILCNFLVCLAVWMSFAARWISGKILAVILPITTFVSVGFEHSIANMYVIPVAMLSGDIPLQLGDFFHNLFFVTVGNIIGGGVLVALIYWATYLKGNANTG